mgnify:CR=1 FL=1
MFNYINRKLEMCLTFVFLVVFFVLSSSDISSLEKDEYLLKAAFLGRLPHFIDWNPPIEQNNKRNFIIVILGKDPFDGKIIDLYANSKIKNKPVKIIKTKELNDNYEPDLLFISYEDKNKVKTVLEKIKGKSILTVSDQEDYAKLGININFLIKSRRLRFNINTSNKNIHFNHRLLKLAENVFN